MKQFDLKLKEVGENNFPGYTKQSSSLSLLCSLTAFLMLQFLYVFMENVF